MGDIETALKLLKIALGINHESRDEYFRSALEAACEELKGRGIELDSNAIEDNVLLADYVEFNYRSRDGEKAMPLNLALRIRNRKTKGRADNGI